MKKRIICLIAVIAVLLNAQMVPVSAESGMGNFKKACSYQNEFSDISKTDWFYSAVINAYENGLATGAGGKFNPNGNLTIAEAVTLAARVCCIYNGWDPANIVPSDPSLWYSGYFDYLNLNGSSLGQYEKEMEKQATRADVAIIFSAALPAAELSAINSVAAVPDVEIGNWYYEKILTLYKAGICTGSDEFGNFLADTYIKRSEAATMVGRMVNPLLRQTFTPKLSKMAITPPDSFLYIGLSQKLQLAPADNYNCAVSFEWISENPKVASVSQDGVVQGKSEGRTKVFAKTGDGKRLAETEITVESLPFENEQLEKCVSSCVQVITYDKNDTVINRSNAVMVDQSGILITTCDAIKGAEYIMVKDAYIWRLVYVASYDEERNLAVLKIENNRTYYTYTCGGYQIANTVQTLFPNFAAISNQSFAQGDELYAVGVKESSYSYEIEVNKYAVEQITYPVGRSNFAQLKLLENSTHTINDGAMLINSKGQLVGILKQSGYNNDVSHTYAVLVTPSDKRISSYTAASNVQDKISKDVPQKGAYICQETAYNDDLNHIIGLTRGRTLVGNLSSVSDIDIYMLTRAVGKVEAEITFEKCLSGALTAEIVDETMTVVAAAQITGDKLKIFYEAESGKTYYLSIHATSKALESNAFFRNAGYIAYIN